MKITFCLLVFLIVPSLVFGQGREYALEASSSIFSFEVEHFGVATVNGTFAIARGTIVYDSNQPDSMSAQITIDVKSIDTDKALRDKELRSEDFLDTERYPTIEFSSTGIGKARNAGQKKTVKGKMTVYGTTRDVELPFLLSLDATGNEATIRSEFVLNRKDYKMKFGFLMDSLVGDEIKVSAVIVGKRK